MLAMDLPGHSACPDLLRQFLWPLHSPPVPCPFPFDCLRFITEYPVLFKRWIIRPFALLLTVLPAPAGFAADDEFQPPPILVPDGFVVELVAKPPLVERPMLASFDDRGRIYVADSAGVNLRGEELL